MFNEIYLNLNLYLAEIIYKNATHLDALSFNIHCSYIVEGKVGTIKQLKFTEGIIFVRTIGSLNYGQLATWYLRTRIQLSSALNLLNLSTRTNAVRYLFDVGGLKTRV